ncbi:MAG: DciA family protein [Lentilitoribacter sp.]
MAEKKAKGRKGAQQIAELTNSLVDPILAKRAGINTMLLGIWDEIVGPEFADCSRPDKIIWPQKRDLGAGSSEQGGGLSPGQLTIACEGSRALFLSHQQDEVLQRINSFFGFPAINRIKIVQKVVVKHDLKRKKLRKLSSLQQKKLTEMVDDVDDPKLKEALTKLGKAVLSKR